ncbi:putative phage tail assembly chaperone, partial [Enterobacter hormaechei]
ELLKRPGAALQLAGKVNEIYAPELEIEVKN